jgi:PAS domain S-box-containing protein
VNRVNPVFPAEVNAHSVPEDKPTAMDGIDELPLPYIEMDAHGVITRANRATIELAPLDRSQLIGMMAWNLVATDEKDPSFAAYCSTLESGKGPEVVRRSVCDRSGRFRTYDLHRNLMRDDAGNPSGMRMLCVDVTEETKALEDAQRTNLWFASVMDSMCEAILVTDAVGFIRSANPAAERLLGCQASELTGMPIEEGLPVLAYFPGNSSECTFTKWLEGPMKGYATVLDRKQCEIHVGMEVSPIVDKENGSTNGVVILLRKVDVGS